MRTKLLFLCLLITMAIGRISADRATVGYCQGESSKSSSFSVEGNRNVSGAILLTPAMLAPYDGCRIVSLRVALASKVNIDLVGLWLRETLDGEDIARTETTSKTDPVLAKGWIETPLASPVTIDASKGLYLGMTYHQKAAAKVFSLIGTGQPNSFFAETEDGEGWTDMHSEGILSIEAVVEGDFSIDHDMALLSAIADVTSDSDNNIVAVRLANNGTKPVEGFTLEARYADGVGGEFPFDDVTIAPGEKAEVTLDVPKNGNIFTNPLTVKLVEILGATDAIADNNSVTVDVPAIKKVFVEEYTTEKCSNCPRVAAYLHEVCEEDAYKGRVVTVCHHSGYYTDWLTQPVDEELMKFYNIGFAPAVSYDRWPYFSDGIFNTPDKADLRKTFDNALAKTPGVKIAMIPVVDEEGRAVEITVNLSRTTLNVADPRLTVYLTEDDIAPIMQSGDKDGTHIHRHVIRAYNSTWGDPIVWTGSSFTMSYRFDLDPEWRLENLNAVVTVGNHNPDDKGDNIIDNAEEVRIAGTTASIDAPTPETTPIRTTYHDINGLEASAGSRGLLVKVTHMSDGSFKTEKIWNIHDGDK